MAWVDFSFLNDNNNNICLYRIKLGQLSQKLLSVKIKFKKIKDIKLQYEV